MSEAGENELSLYENYWEDVRLGVKRNSEIEKQLEQAEQEEALKNKNSKVLLDFVRYCYAHPEGRFWQALRDWSGAHFILAVGGNHQTYGDYNMSFVRQHDTFYREGK